jgi:hypothetical protein
MINIDCSAWETRASCDKKNAVSRQVKRLPTEPEEYAIFKEQRDAPITRQAKAERKYKYMNYEISTG